MESTVAKIETEELREKMGLLKQDCVDVAKTAREKMGMLKHDFADVARTARERAVKGTTEWVKEHPLSTIGITAGVGLVIGLLVGRKLA